MESQKEYQRRSYGNRQESPFPSPTTRERERTVAFDNKKKSVVLIRSQGGKDNLKQQPVNYLKHSVE